MLTRYSRIKLSKPIFSHHLRYFDTPRCRQDHRINKVSIIQGVYIGGPQYPVLQKLKTCPAVNDLGVVLYPHVRAVVVA